MPALADAVALAVIAVVATLTVTSIRAQPGAWQALLALWRSGPWARQVGVDFYGLQVVLALWMLSHAAAADTWTSALLCLLAMPVFGSMAAAAYWLVSV